MMRIVFKKNMPRTCFVPFVEYKRDNIHEVFNFIERFTSYPSSTYLKYIPELNEYRVIPYNILLGITDSEENNLMLQKGYFFVFIGGTLCLMDRKALESTFYIINDTEEYEVNNK